MERETVIASTSSAPSAVGVARGDAGQWLVAWSADGVTRAAWVDDSATPLGEPLLVLRAGAEAPLTGHPEGVNVFWEEETGSSVAAEEIIAVPVAGGGALLAMVQVPGPNRPGGAHAAFVPGPPLEEPPRALRIGPAGPASNRITAVALERRALIAWHDTTPAGLVVRLGSLDLPTMTAPATAVMPGAAARFHPSLAAHGEAVLLAWVEEPPPGGPSGLAIRVAPVGEDLVVGASRLVARTGLHDVAPRLAAFPGGFGLAFRDDEDDDDVLEYHFAALDREGAPLHPPARISRADGARGPCLDWSGSLFFGATVRSFQRNLLVGLNRFDHRGAKQGGEFQVYADKSNFTRTAIAAAGDTAMLVYGEERQAGGRVFISQLRCRIP